MSQPNKTKILPIKIKKLNPACRLPVYAHPTDAGLDLFCLSAYNLQPGEIKSFPLGFSAELPAGYVALVKDRSGLAAKHGIHTLAGVIDADYRGEYTVVLINLSSVSYQFKAGDKIAQLLILPVLHADLRVVSDLSQTLRGPKSFGSTGR